MPPLNPQDALSAVHRGLEWRWHDVPLAVVDVGCEAWALALIAVALYSWLEREVRGVVKASLPLVVALAATAGLSLLARLAGAVPRPAADAHGIAVLLRRTLADGHVAAAAVFATYSILAYGRRGALALLLAGGAAGARIASGPGWSGELVTAAVTGIALAAASYGAALQLFPSGHLARLRIRRRAGHPIGDAADDPSP